jgi:hypothetical protein
VEYAALKAAAAARTARGPEYAVPAAPESDRGNLVGLAGAARSPYLRTVISNETVSEAA